ncbi:MAG: rRNA maturation RNase YbeY [Solirubrobacterales bacterium]
MNLDLVDVPAEFRPAVAAALKEAGIEDGHLAVEIVDETKIHELNLEFRDRDKPTDVLSFPVDEDGPSAGPRELGDVVVCPEFCTDLTEAVVHGVLHLCGHDHEEDRGEMFRLQDKVMAGLDG